MIVSSRGRYALRILVDLALHQQEGYVPMKEMAKRQDISQKYMESIMPVLVKGGLVAGVTGKGGGYRLTRESASITVGEVLRLTKDKAMDPEQVSFSPKHLADLLAMVEKSEVSPQNAKKVFEKVFDDDIDPVSYIEEHGLKIVEDTGLLEEIINKILDANPGPLSELLGGKDKVMGFFVGQIMKEMKGKANPASVRETLMKEVEKRK